MADVTVIIPSELQPLLNQMNLVRKVQTPVNGFFFEKWAGSSRTSEGNCQPISLNTVLNGTRENNRPIRLSGGVRGCTESGVNTKDEATTAFSFYYYVLKRHLEPGWRYSFACNEFLRGRVKLSTLITSNGFFASPDDKTFSAAINIKRYVTVIDGDNNVLFINQEIVNDISAGNSGTQSGFIGETIDIDIDLNNFLTSQFAVSGDSDIIFRFDYVFTLRAKGSLNFVKFSSFNSDNGRFELNNRNLIITPDPDNLFNIDGTFFPGLVSKPVKLVLLPI